MKKFKKSTIAKQKKSHLHRWDEYRHPLPWFYWTTRIEEGGNKKEIIKGKPLIYLFANEKDKAKKQRYYKRIYEQVLNRIQGVIGKKDIGTFTQEDTITYIKKKYNATKLPLKECYPYSNHSLLSIESDPLFPFSEGYMIAEPNEVETFLFPPLTPRSRGKKHKNGFVLVLKFENGILSEFCGGGNPDGYDFLGSEMNMLANKPDELNCYHWA